MRSVTFGKNDTHNPDPSGVEQGDTRRFDPFEVAQEQEIDTAGAASRHQTVKHRWTVSPSCFMKD